MQRTDSSVVVTTIARLVSDATSMKDVVSRLAGILRDFIPFERMYLLRLDRSDSVVLYAAPASGDIEVVGHRIPEQRRSSKLEERAGRGRAKPPFVVPNAPSTMMCPLRHGPRVIGALWFTAETAGVFTSVHHTLIDDVADLVALAVLHDAMESTEAVRRERLDSLEQLLLAMAGSLDVRQVFNEISNVVRAALPHDVLALTSWADNGASLRLYAVAGAELPEAMFWAPMVPTSEDQGFLNAEAYVLRDTSVGVSPESIRGRFFSRVGAKSAVRVPIPLQNNLFGSLFFLSRETDHFREDDIDFARRVASHLALALTHQHLSDAARRDAEARETAARLEAQVAVLKRELDARGGQRKVIGSSARWKDVLTQAARVAPTETTVLLTGDSGTGKEVIARFIHHASRRGQGPFVAINCAALPEQLLESELFGHERGAFTGAVAAKPGRVEQANGGVLFLDEIGEMTTPLQAKLLRVIEEREFLRLGGTKLLHVDIRVIAATNRDLGAAIRRGEFREDLYYRLGVFEIALPPLRERPEDILELADNFLEEIGQTVGRPAAGMARDARDQLLAYNWPGNVRELRNAIERAVILADGGYVRSEHLPFGVPRTMTSTDAGSASLPAGGVDLEAIERSLVTKALRQARYNKTRAAKLLGLTRSQLYSRIEKYGLAEIEP